MDCPLELSESKSQNSCSCQALGVQEPGIICSYSQTTDTCPLVSRFRAVSSAFISGMFSLANKSSMVSCGTVFRESEISAKIRDLLSSSSSLFENSWPRSSESS